jgi:hypothetical protein
MSEPVPTRLEFGYAQAWEPQNMVRPCAKTMAWRIQQSLDLDLKEQQDIPIAIMTRHVKSGPLHTIRKSRAIDFLSWEEEEHTKMLYTLQRKFRRI